MSPDAFTTDEPLPFKQRYRDFQYLAAELCLLERYNRRALADHREGELRLHSFLALTLLSLERFLRMMLGGRATDGDTLPNLLEKATARRSRLFQLEDRDKTIRLVNQTRLVVMHGGLGVTDEAEHLLGYLLPLSFDLFRLANELVAAFDTGTGAARADAKVAFEPNDLALDDTRIVLTPLEELDTLNSRNKAYKPGEPQDGLMMFAEGALCMSLVEAAARQWVGDGVLADDARFRDVLKAAYNSGLRIPFDDPDDGIEMITSVRNTLVHANFEQAARRAGSRDVERYFGEEYAAEIEAMYQMCLDFLAQVRERDGEAS